MDEMEVGGEGMRGREKRREKNVKLSESFSLTRTTQKTNNTYTTCACVCV